MKNFQAVDKQKTEVEQYSWLEIYYAVISSFSKLAFGSLQGKVCSTWTRLSTNAEQVWRHEWEVFFFKSFLNYKFHFLSINIWRKKIFNLFRYNYIQEVASTSRQTVADLQTTVQDLTAKNQALQSENAQLKLTLFRSNHSFQRDSSPLTGGILVPNATEPPSTRSNWNCYQSGGQQQTMQGYQHHSTGTLGQDSDLEDGANVSNWNWFFFFFFWKNVLCLVIWPFLLFQRKFE